MAGGSMRQIFEAMLMGSIMSENGGRKMTGISTKTNQKDLIFLKGLFEAVKIKSIIDRTYPLSETAEALRYLGTGHASGKIVITMDSSS
jgi:NADPH:quinone reductase-like Zn-dependent oxidoreductase